jgi:hypothetical protein
MEHDQSGEIVSLESQKQGIWECVGCEQHEDESSREYERYVADGVHTDQGVAELVVKELQGEEALQGELSKYEEKVEEEERGTTKLSESKGKENEYKKK